jgi:hypothetical protein
MKKSKKFALACGLAAALSGLSLNSCATMDPPSPQQSFLYAIVKDYNKQIDEFKNLLTASFNSQSTDISKVLSTYNYSNFIIDNLIAKNLAKLARMGDFKLLTSKGEPVLDANLNDKVVAVLQDPETDYNVLTKSPEIVKAKGTSPVNAAIRARILAKYITDFSALNVSLDLIKSGDFTSSSLINLYKSLTKFNQSCIEIIAYLQSYGDKTVDEVGLEVIKDQIDAFNQKLQKDILPPEPAAEPTPAPAPATSMLLNFGKGRA